MILGMLNQQNGQEVKTVSRFKEYMEVSKSSYRFVTITNQKEMNQFIKWSDSENKTMGQLRSNEKFPIYLSWDGQIIGWTDSDNRSADYLSFEEFKQEVGIK